MNRPRLVDLHTHSTASDGSYPPAEVVRLAASRKLAAVALTDHDTLDGLAEAQEAAKAFPDLRFVRGVEVSARFAAGTLHLLGFAFDPASPRLRELLERLRSARNERNQKMIARLRQMGLDIRLAEALAVAARDRVPDGNVVVGRPHVAEVLRRKGYVRTIQKAFEKYIGKDAPGYVDRERIAPREVIAAIHDGGGAAVVAHPSQLAYQNHAQLERMVRGLIHDGIDGIEVYHGDHTASQTRLYLDLARRLDLGITGGSDFHGPPKPDAALGRPRVPLSVIPPRFAERLFAGT